jgi:hypothetical protein
MAGLGMRFRRLVLFVCCMDLGSFASSDFKPRISLITFPVVNGGVPSYRPTNSRPVSLGLPNYANILIFESKCHHTRQPWQ